METTNQNFEPTMADGNLYRLEEMADSMTQSLNNLSHVIEDQTALIDLVKQNDAELKFETFIKESTDQLENMKDQHKRLSAKRDDLVALCQKAREDYTAQLAIEILCDILGVFNRA